MIWLGASSTVAMLGYALSMLIVLTLQLLFFRHSLLSVESADRTETITDHQWRTRILTYSWPFATWGIFTWVQLSSDRWALQVFASTQDVGLYAVLYQMGYYPTIILVGLTVQLVSPMLFQRAGDASDLSRMREVHIINRRLTVGALLLTAIAVLCAFALHRLIFDWLVAPDYRAVSWLMPGMVLASGLFACGQVAAISLLSDTETRILIAPKIATALVGILLNIVGAALWGIVGVVFAGVVTAVMYLVWIWFLTFRSRK
jgi:O-antigen/teichoic acid export membrane protein